MKKYLKDVQNVGQYIEDCLVHTKTWEEPANVLHEVLQKAREAKLPLPLLLG